MSPLFHIVLHQPEIPQNTGNVGRTCLATGGKLWLVRPLGFRVDEHSVRRAGLDYWEHVDWEVADDWGSVAGRLPDQRAWFFTKTSKRLYTEARFEPGDLFVFGSETRGLPPAMLQQHADRCLRIPTRPLVRSLNLSAAVAVIVYEALRQWQARGLVQLE